MHIRLRRRHRVEAAQRQLERTDRGLKQIALDCGFGNAEVMRRSFVRLVGVTPDQYRRTLNAAKADPQRDVLPL